MLISANNEIDDVIELASILVYLDAQLSDLFKITFEREMAQTKGPDVIMKEILSDVIIEMNEHVILFLSCC